MKKFMKEIKFRVTRKLWRSMVNEIFSKFCSGQVCDIYIFGAGMYGRDIYYELVIRGVKIKCFLDNDKNKKGYITDDTYCVLPEDIINKKDNVLIIVAVKYPEAILSQLTAKRFPYVVTIYEIKQLLMKYNPINHLEEFDILQNIDYSTDEAIDLLITFNQKVYQIQRNYMINKVYELNNTELENNIKNKEIMHLKLELEMHLIDFNKYYKAK